MDHVEPSWQAATECWRHGEQPEAAVAAAAAGLRQSHLAARAAEQTLEAAGAAAHVKDPRSVTSSQTGFAG